MTTAEKRSGRIPSLDGLRGLAILGVLLFHVDYFLGGVSHGALPRAFHHVVSFGWAGVDLFFVLSGFLITGILLDTAKTPGFLWTFYSRRALRIFPLYYTFLICFFVFGPLLLLAMHRASLIESQLLPSRQIFAWLYMVNWFGGSRHFNSFPQFIQHFWSLSVEEQFYIAWPLVVHSLDRVWLKRVCGLLVVGSVLSRLVCLAGGLDAAAYTWTICRLDGLAIGALIAVCVRDSRERQAIGDLAPVFTIALAGVVGVIAFASLRMPFASWCLDAFGATLVALLFGGCLVLALSPSRNPIGVFTSLAVLRIAGKYSYGAYVWHQPIIIFLRKLGFRSDVLVKVLQSEFAAVIVANALPMALTAMAAFASWHLLEKHFLRLRDHPAMKRGAPIAEVERASVVLPDAG